MNPKSEAAPSKFANRMWGFVATVLTLGLVASVLVMLYALAAGLLRRVH